MKNFRKLTALILAAVMILAMGSAAFAASEKVTPAGTEPGQITVTNSTTSVSLDGRTFRAYKILNATATVNEEDTTTPKEYKNVSYSVPDYMVPFFTNNTATGLDLNLTGIPTDKPSAALDKAVTDKLGAMTDDSAELIAFAEKALAWAKANVNYYEATGAANATSVVFEHLPLGYYLVDDQTTGATNGNAVSAVILDTTTPRQSIVVKASTVPSDKEITGVNTGETGETNVTANLEDNDADTKNEVVDVSIGDIVHFKVDSAVPDTRGYNYYKFVVNDTLDKGLKLDKSTIKVTVDGTEYTVANGGIEVTTDPPTPTGEGATTLKIVLKNALAKFTATDVEVGDAIAITYDAELTADAPIGTKVENTVTIDYTNNPKVDVDHTSDDFKNTDPKGTTPEKKTETYTTEITIKKVDENGKPLPGAEFTLTGTAAHTVLIYDETYTEDNTNGIYWKLNDGSYTTDDPATPGMDTTKYASTETKYSLVKNTSAKTTVDENTNRNGVKKTTGTDGVITFSGLGEGTYTITETGVPAGYNGIDPITTVITFTYNSTSGKGEFSATNLTADGDNTFSTVIQNRSGQELPSTGGIGTTLFYVVGAILVIGAGILLVTRRRMGRE